uniref:Uncharacterized protein n=1 Tax=Physcomitrium patens TaxID=3218 RepID=A0A7I4DMI0_PHYPA
MPRISHKGSSHYTDLSRSSCSLCLPSSVSVGFSRARRHPQQPTPFEQFTQSTAIRSLAVVTILPFAVTSAATTTDTFKNGGGEIRRRYFVGSPSTSSQD